MKSEQVVVWAQVVATLLVGIGLLLVIVQMRQTESLTRAQIASDALSLVVTGLQGLGGEDIADSIAKSCLEPSKMTPADLVRVDAYFESLYMMTARARQVQRVGDFDYELDDIRRAYFEAITRFRHGPWWLEKKRSLGWPLGTESVVNDAIENSKDYDCGDYYREMAAVK